jgi:hypothetical protein
MAGAGSCVWAFERLGFRGSGPSLKFVLISAVDPKPPFTVSYLR